MGFQETGEKYITWDSTDDNGLKVSSGIYFAIFEIERLKKINKLMLLKQIVFYKVLKKIIFFIKNKIGK